MGLLKQVIGSHLAARAFGARSSLPLLAANVFGQALLAADDRHACVHGGASASIAAACTANQRRNGSSPA
jgi:hypothetical protein